MSFVLVIHLFTTFFMTGLCWFVQIVHYPLFKAVDPKDFPGYERKNYVTGFVTVPIMIIEMITGVYLLFQKPDSTFTINIILIAIILLSTMIYQVPIHLRLMNSYSDKLITRVIRTNWIRTISWSLRSILLSFYLMEVIN